MNTVKVPPKPIPLALPSKRLASGFSPSVIGPWIEVIGLGWTGLIIRGMMHQACVPEGPLLSTLVASTYVVGQPCEVLDQCIMMHDRMRTHNRLRHVLLGETQLNGLARPKLPDNAARAASRMPPAMPIDSGRMHTLHWVPAALAVLCNTSSAYWNGLHSVWTRRRSCIQRFQQARPP
jgi:hypothetical protein